MRVLISGAGLAGSTLAYWLAQYGSRVTVVERAAGRRSAGNPVDVKGPAVAVVEQMGIMPQVRAAASRVDRLVLVDAAGHERASVSMKAFQGSAGDREVEIARSDLAAILLSAVRGRADIRWGDSITGLVQDPDGVDVTFDRAEPERFDLVVGADGLHSTVRRLAFGPEPGFVRHMGMYVMTLPVERPIRGEREVLLFNTAGRALAVHPAHGNPGAAFMFRHPAVPDFDHRDVDLHKRLVTEAFAGRLGCFADVLDRVQIADDLYFDSVSRVRLPRWSTGRVTLVGDAASCLSLFGDGSTLAVAGGYTLAEELARTPDDLPAALRRYEQHHRRLATSQQRGLLTAATMLLVPRSRAGIALRNSAVRLMEKRVRAESRWCHRGMVCRHRFQQRLATHSSSMPRH
jgi:2-polyprenyl-6-methoxyphenol hydroxylase-like FAD-dependent oxidoreductase